MGRRIVGVIAGFIVSGVVVALVEAIGHLLFPPPPGVDVHNPEAMAGLMAQIPLGAKIAVLVAWTLGALAGGYTAAKLAAPRGTAPALIVGGILLAAGAYTLATIPHPIWMVFAGLALPLPVAWCGAKLARPPSSSGK